MIVSGLASCSSAPAAGFDGPCVPGVVLACVCADGTSGVQACGADRNPEPCRCGPGEGAEPDPTGRADFLLDFGAVPVGERASLALPLANPGEDHLVFEVGSVPPPFLVETAVPLSVPPQGAGELRFGFRPGAEASADVVLNLAAGSSVFTVRLAGTGFEPRIECDADRLDFGDVPRTEPAVRELRCINRASQPLALSAAVEGGGGFSVAPLPAAPRARGEAWTVALTVAPERSGEFAGTLLLATPGGTVVEELALSARTVGPGFACEPTTIDYGRMAPGSGLPGQVRCRNFNREPVSITGFARDLDSDTAFSWSLGLPAQVPAYWADRPGEKVIEIWFHPPEGVFRSYEGRAVMTTSDPGAPRIDFLFRGAAVGPGLSCTPEALHFGNVIGGLPATRETYCTNVGTEHLQFSWIQTSNPEFAAAVVGGTFEERGYAVGEGFAVTATYHPEDEGADRAVMRLWADADGWPSIPFEVPLEGAGQILPPCEVEVVPAELRFGEVAPGAAAVLEFAVVNRSDFDCVVANLRLAPSCGSDFSLPRGEVAGDVVPPLGDSRYQVRFAPTTLGAQACEVRFDVSNPDDPHRVVPVTGFSKQPCISFDPPAINFGAWEPGCARPDREVVVRNYCSTSFPIERVELGATVSNAFVLRSSPPAGTVLAPGGEASIVVGYVGTDEGTDLGALYVYLGAEEPALIPLEGRGDSGGIQTDSFVQDKKSCFELGRVPADRNANGVVSDVEGELVVRLNGVVTPSADAAGQELWRYDPATHAVCFGENGLPPSGTMVEVTYKAACNPL